MFRISYAYAPVDDKELFVDTKLLFLNNSLVQYRLNDTSFLVSDRNIGPSFGLFVSGDGKQYKSLRVAGTLFTEQFNGSQAVINLSYKNHLYRFFISIYKTEQKRFGHRCDFVVTGLFPHNDPANLLTFGSSIGEVNLDSLKELLTFNVDITEEAIFNTEGGFTLKQLEIPQETKKRKQLHPDLAYLDTPVDTKGIFELFQNVKKSQAIKPDPRWAEIVQNLKTCPF
jgi:hypothetical protein